ncbi:hypothetical protein SOVF_122580 [Spinacia oleracea]|nr:hypothetical protein SOVF_122580 [Spinacia oleracea]
MRTIAIICLGFLQSANTSKITKSYYKLSLKYHPDKNPDPESKKLFVKVANANGNCVGCF